MKSEQASVKVKIGDKELVGPYTRKEAEPLSVDTFVADASAMVKEFFDKVRSGKETALAAVTDCFNYGFDLKVKASVRQEIISKEAGPDKALAAAEANLIKAFIAFGMSESEAEQTAKAQLANARSVLIK